MPRYLLETDLVAGGHVEGAEGLTVRRFPEIAVERRYSTQDRTGARAIWVCRAPSEAHIGRWAAALHLSVASVRRVVTYDPRTLAPRARGTEPTKGKP
jgi:hypothetical protein